VLASVVNDPFHPYGALQVVTFVPQFSWYENGTREIKDKWWKPYKGVL
jgi:hypothetical protein